MNHVHWGLFALSFVLGLGFTLALLARPVKRRVRERAPVRVPQREPVTERLSVPDTQPNNKVANKPYKPDIESPTVKIRVADESPTTRIPVAKDFPGAPTTRIPIAKDAPTTKIPVVPSPPYGPGSADADAEGAGPAGWLIKGRSDTRLYYTPDDARYDQVVAQVWFKDEQCAVRASFTSWRKKTRK